MDDNVKGLKNNGNNMCFLNVIVQAMWNLVSVKQFVMLSFQDHNHDRFNPEYIPEIASFLEILKIEIEDKNSKINPEEIYKLESILLEAGKENKNSKTKNKEMKEKKKIINIEELPLNDPNDIKVLNTKIDRGCLYCVLQDLFYNFTFSEAQTLNVEFLRSTLMTLNHNIQKFNEKGVKYIDY